MVTTKKHDFSEVWEEWRSYLGPIGNIELAEICEVSSAAVSGWVNGSRSPRQPKLVLVSSFIHELIRDGKVHIPAYNRKIDSTVSTNYSHASETPSAEVIFETFLGIKSVHELLLQQSGLSDHQELVDTESMWTRFLTKPQYRAGLPASVLLVFILAAALKILGTDGSREENYSLSGNWGEAWTMDMSENSNSVKTYTITSTNGTALTLSKPSPRSQKPSLQ